MNRFSALADEFEEKKLPENPSSLEITEFILGYEEDEEFSSDLASFIDNGKDLSRETSFELNGSLSSEIPKNMKTHFKNLKSVALSLYKLEGNDVLDTSKSRFFRKDLATMLNMTDFINRHEAICTFKWCSPRSLYFNACCVFNIHPSRESLFDKSMFIAITEEELYLAKRGIVMFASKEMTNFIIRNGTRCDTTSSNHLLSIEGIEELEHYILLFSKKIGNSEKHINLQKEIHRKYSGPTRTK